MSAPSFAPILVAAQAADPAHVGLIMDGNGRWAQARGLSRAQGHEAGLESFRRLLNASVNFGVPILSVYGFSTENWKRPTGEVSALMTLLIRYLTDHRHEFLAQDCRFIVTGRRAALSAPVRQLIDLAEHETRDCQSRLLNLALSYGGREEICDAAKALAMDVAAGKISADAIDEATFATQLYSAPLPDPDLIIRTSGEQRLSGFLPWQSAYSELLFHPSMWPDFTPEEFLKCLDQYRQRERRFGLV